MLTTVSDGLEFALTSGGDSANSLLAECDGALGAIDEMLKRELSEARFLTYSQKIAAIREAFATLLTDIDDMRIISDLANGIFKGAASLIKNLDAEKEIQKEIVFFPYKASMWDSFESIWAAASADERCFVSVVPILYYNKDGAGNFTTAHYEGDFFPDDVGVIHYEEFDVAAILPDVAYIHNPYDGGNLVTSVHPDYYSRELKKHVGTLVYVPYYASDSRPTLSFAAPAAALTADVLVASCEEDAEAYRRAGVKYKIAPLGSPKTDKIINSEKNRPEIPEEWVNLRGKKVFFLNTSVASMLRFSESYFQKLHALFALFAERGDVALLWRPHPLTLATIGSMRPQLRGAYNALETAVRAGRLGVIDHTHDMSRAISVSDAYIGDGASSLTYLYALTGKPMYILNFKMSAAPAADELQELRGTEVVSPPCITAAGDAWVFCLSVNALCRFDIDSARAEYAASVPGEMNTGGLYGAPADIGGGRLLLPPMKAGEWAIFDTGSGEFEKRPIPEKYRSVVRNGSHFAFAFASEEFVIFRPVHSTAFVKYDKAAGRFDYFTDWYKKFEPYVFNIEWGLLGGLFAKPEDDALFFTSPQGNIMLELNTRSMKTSVRRVGTPGKHYSDVAYDGRHFWLTSYMPPGTHERKNAVVRFDKKTGACKEYPMVPVTFDPRNEFGDFAGIHFFRDKVWVFPYGVNEIFRIDPLTEEVSRFETGLPYALADRKSPYYAFMDGTAGVLWHIHGENCLIFFSYYDNSLLFIDAGTGETRKQKLTADGIDALLEHLDPVPPYIYGESAFITGAAFVAGVKTGAIAAFDNERAAYSRGVNVNTDGSCGEKVHAFVMGDKSK
jgi:streptogramin lyase